MLLQFSIYQAPLPLPTTKGHLTAGEHWTGREYLKKAEGVCEKQRIPLLLAGVFEEGVFE